jgi:3-deoxy-D-manno-octulosonate 8-phosphate phosphatase KdsC-like HAD superfamily phosphatase
MAIERTFRKTIAGTVKVKYVIFDVDGCLEEGIRISGDELYDDIKMYDYHDVRAMTIEELDKIIEENNY